MVNITTATIMWQAHHLIPLKIRFFSFRFCRKLLGAGVYIWHAVHKSLDFVIVALKIDRTFLRI